MDRRRLGRTDIEVSPLGLGGLFVSRVGGRGRDEARAAIHRALDLGINWIDTAPTYADSEEVLGIALEDVTRPYCISTKLGGRPSPFDPKNKDHLRRSLDESLTLLKRDAVDVLLVHEPERPGQYDWWEEWDTFSGPVNDVLDELKDEGLIRHTGIGGTTAYAMARIMTTGRFDVVLTAFNYALLWREAETSILPEAKRQDMGVIIGSPLHQGALAQRHDDEVENGAPWMTPMRRAQLKALYAVLDDTGLSLPEMSLRWVLSNPDISMTLTGSRSVEEVEQNVASVEKGPLPSDILGRLDEIYAMLPYRPFEEPVTLALGRDHLGVGQVR
ncbi:aldo/keto reductase [Candidatus Poribacteria bacterium]|jgi:aryl-alcohol dehydrogenase-like predicted oxidoreductase|nr:aldo/keto reductase [Candidatus Poribacteria bacterium]MBT5534622.1 aldo/keto reductase [Candidatus Poribacteria bacterium]MBT7099445.1 aldo/keto reductase [Candidatus Poribacteria bacterium]MBT7804198.1 aldo/keto reductase [Candidatus Poribacteria bacterium]